MKTRQLPLILLTCVAFSFSSCATLFTPTKQEITFTGENGIGIYDKSKKLGMIDKEGTATIKVKKELSSKTLFAKKEGYDRTPVQIESTLNPISLLNLLFLPGWIVDIVTGKVCKWDDDIIEVEMRKKDD